MTYPGNSPPPSGLPGRSAGNQSGKQFKTKEDFEQAQSKLDQDKGHESRLNELKAQLPPAVQQTIDNLRQQHASSLYATNVLTRHLSEVLETIDKFELDLTYKEFEQLKEDAGTAFEKAQKELPYAQKANRDAILAARKQKPPGLSREEEDTYDKALDELVAILDSSEQEHVNNVNNYQENFTKDLDRAFRLRGMAYNAGREANRRLYGEEENRRRGAIGNRQSYAADIANLKIHTGNESEEIKFNEGQAYTLGEGWILPKMLTDNVPGLGLVQDLIRGFTAMAEQKVTCTLTKDSAKITGPAGMLATERDRRPYFTKALLMLQANGMTELNVDSSTHPEEVLKIAVSLGLKVKSNNPRLQRQIQTAEAKYQHELEVKRSQSKYMSASDETKLHSAANHVVQDQLKQLDKYTRDVASDRPMSREAIDAYNNFIDYVESTDQLSDDNMQYGKLGSGATCGAVINNADNGNLLTRIDRQINQLEQEVNDLFKESGGPPATPDYKPGKLDSAKEYWDAFWDTLFYKDDSDRSRFWESPLFRRATKNTEHAHNPEKYAEYEAKKAQLDELRAQANQLITALEKDYGLSVDINITPEQRIDNIHKQVLDADPEGQVAMLESLRQRAEKQNPRQEEKAFYKEIIDKITKSENDTQIKVLADLLTQTKANNKTDLNTRLISEIERAENKSTWVNMIKLVTGQNGGSYTEAKQILFERAGRDNGSHLIACLGNLSAPESVTAKSQLLDYWLTPAKFNTLPENVQRDAAFVNRLKEPGKFDEFMRNPDYNAKAKAAVLEAMYPDDPGAQAIYLFENNLQNSGVLNELGKASDIVKAVDALQKLKTKHENTSEHKLARANIMKDLTSHSQRVMVMQLLINGMVHPNTSFKNMGFNHQEILNLIDVVDRLSEQYLPTPAANQLSGIFGGAAQHVEPPLRAKVVIATLHSTKLNHVDKLQLCDKMLNRQSDGTPDRDKANWTDAFRDKEMKPILKDLLSTGKQEDRNLARDLFNRCVPDNPAFGEPDSRQYDPDANLSAGVTVEDMLHKADPANMPAPAAPGH